MTQRSQSQFQGGGTDGAPVHVEYPYTELADLLFRFALSLLRDRTEAEDVVQDVYVSVLASPAACRAAQNPKAYLLRSVRNRALDRLRSSRAKTVSLGEEQFEYFAVTHQEGGSEFDADQLRRINLELSRLPVDQREAVSLRVSSGMSYPEMGELAGVSAKTMQSRVRLGLERIRKALS